jgi:hypothetical protein
MHTLLGPVIQNGYVVDDLEAAARHWAEKLGVGPFYVFDSVAFDTVRYRGKPSPIEMSMAIGYWGELQIELIRPLNDAPSIYRDFAERGLTGLQHVGVLTDDLSRDLAALARRGVHPVQDGVAANGTAFAYVDTDFHPGGMVEIIETSPALAAGFAAIRKAADAWDGRDPVRRF